MKNPTPIIFVGLGALAFVVSAIRPQLASDAIRFARNSSRKFTTSQETASASTRISSSPRPRMT